MAGPFPSGRGRGIGASRRVRFDGPPRAAAGGDVLTMSTSNDERAARLKAALRDNLRRRKAQVRGRAEEAGPAQAEPPAPAPRETPDRPND